MIGFIRDRAIVMSMVNENYFLNGIEDKKQILYPSLGVEGWFSDEKIIVVNEEKISGFVVTKVDGNKQLFQKGDIILQVNGRPADRTNMWYTINNQKVRVSIWRSGSTIEAQAAVLEL
jgi:S1-C subfamily serine protease